MMSPSRHDAFAPILPCEIMAPNTYAWMRDSYRRTMADYRRKRRLLVGDRMTLLFENRTTVLFHIHEILHIENQWHPKRIQEEIEAYAPLVPCGNCLTATVMLDRGGPEFAQTFNAQLREQRALALQLGSESYPAVCAEPHVDDEEPVRFLRFELGHLRRMHLMWPSLPLSIHQPDGAAHVDLSPDLRAALVHDLAN